MRTSTRLLAHTHKLYREMEDMERMGEGYELREETAATSSRGRRGEPARSQEFDIEKRAGRTDRSLGGNAPGSAARSMTTQGQGGTRTTQPVKAPSAQRKTTAQPTPASSSPASRKTTITPRPSLARKLALRSHQQQQQEEE